MLSASEEIDWAISRSGLMKQSMFVGIGRLLVQSGWSEAYLIASRVEKTFQVIGPVDLKKYVEDYTPNYKFDSSLIVICVEYQHSHPADYSISCFNLKGPCTFYFKFDGAVLRVTSRPINEDQFRFVIDVVDALTLELGIAERLDNVTKRLEKFESTLNQLKMLADFLAPGQKR